MHRGSAAPYGPDMIAGALLGIVYAASPGPVNVATLRRGLRGGFRGGLAVQLGAILGDLPYVALGLLGSAELVQRIPREPIAALGTVVLLSLGWASLRGGRARARLESGHEPSDARRRPAFIEGVAISATNPFAIVFWVSVSGSVLSGRSPAQLTAALIGFLVGELLSGLAVAALIGWGGSMTGPRFHRAASMACGIGMIFLGLSIAPWMLR